MEIVEQKSQQDPVDYGFADGTIHYEKRLFNNDGTVTLKTGSVPVISDETDPSVNSCADELADASAKVITGESKKESVE